VGGGGRGEGGGAGGEGGRGGEWVGVSNWKIWPCALAVSWPNNRCGKHPDFRFDRCVFSPAAFRTSGLYGFDVLYIHVYMVFI
jgi:hypothetical protein